jgi:anti-sigma B factor antagonist
MERERRFERRTPVSSLVVVHGRTGSAEVLSLVGHLDLSSVGRLVAQAADAIRGGRARLILDLAGIEFVDSAGLAGLLNVLRRAERAGGGVVLVHASPELRRVMALTRLDREFVFAETLPRAEAALLAATTA